MKAADSDVLTAEGALVSVNLNSRGMLAVTAEESGGKGKVSVYDADLSLLFAFTARRRFVADACVTEDGKYLAAVTLGQEESVFVSNVVIYDLTQEMLPWRITACTDGLVTAMGGQGDRIVTVSDTCLTVRKCRRGNAGHL